MAKNAIAPWKHKKLADVAQVQTGIAKNKEQVLVDPVEIPYLRVANVQDGHLDLSEIKTIAVESSRVDRYALEDGDVLMTEGGDFDKLGRGAVWRNQITPCLHQNHVFAVRVNRKHLLPEFLAAYCAAEPGRRYFLACSKQTTNLASINSSQLKELPLQLPSLDEQRRIVRVLNAADRLIRLERVHTEHLHQLRRAVVSRSISLANAERAKKLALSELADVRMSGVDKKTVQGESVVLLCNYMDVFYNEVINEEVDFMRASATQTEIDRFTLRQGDVLLTKDSEVADEIAECAVVESDLPGVLCGYHLALLRPDKKRVLGQYLAIALREPHVRHQFARCANGVTRFGLTLDAFDQIEIALPGLKEQQKVAEIYATLSKRINASKWLAEQLVAQKRGLMQQLLTGQQRLTRDLPGMAVADD